MCPGTYRKIGPFLFAYVKILFYICSMKELIKELTEELESLEYRLENNIPEYDKVSLNTVWALIGEKKRTIKRLTKFI